MNVITPETTLLQLAEAVRTATPGRACFPLQAAVNLLAELSGLEFSAFLAALFTALEYEGLDRDIPKYLADTLQVARTFACRAEVEASKDIVLGEVLDAHH